MSRLDPLLFCSVKRAIRTVLRLDPLFVFCYPRPLCQDLTPYCVTPYCAYLWTPYLCLQKLHFKVDSAIAFFFVLFQPKNVGIFYTVFLLNLEIVYLLLYIQHDILYGMLFAL